MTEEEPKNEIIEEIPEAKEKQIINKIKQYIHKGNILCDEGMKGDIKKVIFYGASMTMQIPAKRIKFEEKLSNDEYLNKYAERNVVNPISNLFLNQHMRAGILYGYHYLKSKE